MTNTLKDDTVCDDLDYVEYHYFSSWLMIGKFT